MALDFLNDARSYDTGRQWVSFWGHDGTFEVTFRLDDQALCRFAGLKSVTEAEALGAFDKNLGRIREGARKLYKRSPKRYLEMSLADI